MAAAERQARRAGRVQPLPSVLPRIEQWQVRNAAIIQRLADGASMQTVAKEFGITRQRVSKIAFRVTGQYTRPLIRLDSRTRRGVAVVMGRRVETLRDRAEVGRFWIRNRSEGTSFKAAAAPSHMDR
jgi:predicted transcriptional regulator